MDTLVAIISILVIKVNLNDKAGPYLQVSTLTVSMYYITLLLLFIMMWKYSSNYLVVS